MRLVRRLRTTFSVIEYPASHSLLPAFMVCEILSLPMRLTLIPMSIRKKSDIVGVFQARFMSISYDMNRAG